MAIGFGLFGGWDWVSIVGLPVHPHPVSHVLGACLTAIPIAIPFLVWGLLVAWREQWRGLARVLAVCCAIVLLVLSLLVAVARVDLASLKIAAGTLIVFVVLSLLFRGGLGLLHLAFRRWRRAGYAALVAAVVLAVLLGTAVIWPLDLLGGRPEVVALRAVHRHAQAQGWDVRALELDQVGSASVTVRVRLTGDAVRICTSSVWWEPTVTCEP